MDETNLPETGVEIFEASTQEAEVIRRIDGEDLDPEAIRREQEAEAEVLAPSGGVSESAESQELLAEARALIPEKEDIDLLDSEFETLEELLDEIYGRLESGLVDSDDLTCYIDIGIPTIGVIDYSTEEHLFINPQRLTAEDLKRTAFKLGIAPETLLEMLQDDNGSEWLFRGEDPSEWSGPLEEDPDDVEAEVSELAGMWDTPEVVDEDELPDAGLGKRGDDGSLVFD